MIIKKIKNDINEIIKFQKSRKSQFIQKNLPATAGVQVLLMVVVLSGYRSSAFLWKYSQEI